MEQSQLIGPSDFLSPKQSKIYCFILQFNTMRACKGMNFGVQTSLLTIYIMSTSKSYYNPRNSQILWCYWYFTITLSSDQWTARHHTMTPTYLSVASLTMLAAVLSPKTYYLIFLDVIFLRACRGLPTQCAHYLNIIKSIQNTKKAIIILHRYKLVLKVPTNYLHWSLQQRQATCFMEY